MSWKTVYYGQLTPPFEPPLQGPSDTKFFDSYPDSEEDLTVPLQGEELALFDVFSGI